ncbi:MAG TPA: hypothetical protein VG796_20475 [Verrucomicrobiales bacterium]|nr:hypothetical protein [Verrucomicrobiales bacterium]
MKKPIPHLLAAALAAAVLPASAADVNVSGPSFGGLGITGVNSVATLGTLGTARQNSGVSANVNDGNTATRVDTFFPGNTGTYSYAGVLWPYKRADSVKSVTMTIAAFSDGGWFGFSNATPGAGKPLTGAQLVDPAVQVTTDGGVTWTSVDVLVDATHPSYTDQLLNHLIGGGSPAVTNPNPKAFTLTLDTPVSGINGIRVIGENGGTADGNGFLGVFELVVTAGIAADTDLDGMEDAWETANGLVVGVDDSAGNPDGDGLTNVQEFNAHSNPNSTDSDGDTLPDGVEVNTLHSYPGATDSDWDGLTDNAEVNTHLTDPTKLDTDGDTLADGAEVNTHHTNPTLADTDGDQFSDGVEVARLFDPLSNTSRPLNIASTGAGVCGVNDAIDGDAGTVFSQDGNTQAIFNRLIDENFTTRIQTFHASNPGNFSYAGVTWATARALPVAEVELTMACFADGGWFGRTGVTPGLTPDTRVLTAASLPEPADMPVVQVTTTDVPAWTTVPGTTNYATEAGMLNQPLGGAGPVTANPTVSKTIVFKLDAPVANVTGVRVIGKEGGTAGGGAIAGFIGVFEIVVKDTFGLNNWDFDGDLLTDADEITRGTNTTNRDTDGDGFMDGLEVRFGTNPLSFTNRPANIARAGIAMSGVNNAIDADNGTSVTNAQFPAASPLPYPIALLASNNVNDNNFTTRVDTFNTTATNVVSYVGVRWPRLWPEAISRLELTLATFTDGGWFGPNGTSPAPGTALTAAHLTVPTIQTSVDGFTWVNAPGTVTSDYVAKLTGHVIGGPALNPTSRKAVFTLNTPVPANTIKAIRIIGSEGGNAGGGFLGIFELNVQDSTTADDLDGDGLLNSEEVTLGTDPENADTDGDGLSDGAEVRDYSSNPLSQDTDGDHFKDNLEVQYATALFDPFSFPSNIAPLGTAIMGVNDAIDSDAGTTSFQAGVLANINDGNATTRVDTYNGAGGVNSFVGILWPSLQTVKTVSIRFATFYDGGWFGVNATDPGEGGALNSTYLVEPTLQVTTDGGVTWTTVPHTSDYLTALDGHAIGNRAAVNPTNKAATFTLDNAATGVNGVRVIGQEGGTASQGFLGVFEMEASSEGEGFDQDADGLPDGYEVSTFGYVHAMHGHSDPDLDGTDLLLEFGFGLDIAAPDFPPAAVLEGGYLTMTITKRPGVNYTVLSGSDSTDLSTADTTVITNNATTLKVRDNILYSVGPRRFMTTSVSFAP